MFDKRYSDLNEEQRRAVDAIDGPVLVIAGPGSGKTEILSIRTLNILKKTDLHPSSILCLTFTDNASINMQERLAELIGADAYKIAVHTFHSFGQSVMNRYPQYFFKGMEFLPLDNIEKMEILESVLDKLPHDNPFSDHSEHRGFTNIGRVESGIQKLKEGGLSPEDFATIAEENKKYLEQTVTLTGDFFENNSLRKKATVEKFAELVKDLSSIPSSSENFKGYKSFKERIVETAEQALNDALEEGAPPPITAWKNKHLEKNSENRLVFKDFLNIKKHLALAEIYKAYQEEIFKKGRYDFTDMILGVTNAIEENPELKFNLQEQYQYILVDEFQDTNGAQMMLLNTLLDAEVHEGRPNIFAVGDDDQSIFKFQGAKLANIMGFKDKFRDPEIVVLKKNYRSTPSILELARKTILKGEERLENIIPEVVKELEPAGKDLEEGVVEEKEFHDQFHEIIWVAEEIEKRIKAGENPNEIAVISRKHDFLEKLAKFLDHKGIPVSYERKKNILEQKHIKEILTILRFVSSMNKVGQSEADELLPEILAFEFFDVPRIDIWKISIEARGSRKEPSKPWLRVMLDHEDEKIKKIAEFLIEISGFATEWTGEEIIDAITGARTITLPDGEEYSSPYKSHYFGSDGFEKNKNKFLDYLAALTSLVEAVRSFEGGAGTLTADEIVDFINLYEKYSIPFTYTTSYSLDEKSIPLLTVHGAKGLEFETVFGVGCTEKAWFGKGGNFNNFTFPVNVPLSPEADDEDDALRLFYVMISRAKKNLYITYSNFENNGKGVNKLRFLEDRDIKEKLKSPAGIKPKDVEDKQLSLAKEKDLIDFYKMEFNPSEHEQYTQNENALLKGLLENYRLSVTHLQNFLDLRYGGPQTFVERNLLQFPQKQNMALSYGNAIHKALELFHKEFRSRGSIPPVDKLISLFEESLLSQRLNKNDFSKALEKGRDQLKIYYSARKDSFDPNDLVELSFLLQNVVVGGVPLNGKLDKVKVVNKNEMQVFDLKTGTPLEAWSSKIKSMNYKHQLIFYKVLVENSRDYSNYRVNEGVMEFVEPLDDKIILLPHSISDSEVVEMKKLMKAVYTKIVNLDFPDVSSYPKDKNGEFNAAAVREFKKDLIEGAI